MQHDQLPWIVKDMMQVPRTLLAAETVRYEYQGAHREGGRGPPVCSRVLCGWNLEVGTWRWRVQDAVRGWGKATRDRHVGPGLGPDPGVHPPKNYQFPNY